LGIGRSGENANLKGKRLNLACESEKITRVSMEVKPGGSKSGGRPGKSTLQITLAVLACHIRIDDID
jgi:hypothetical protein